MIFYPMVISAVAVLVTLIYASYLDIRDRRVPFRTWYPMLIVGIAASIVFFYQQTGNISLIVGYIALIASFLYADLPRQPRGRNPVPAPVPCSRPCPPRHILVYYTGHFTGKLPETQLSTLVRDVRRLIGYVSYREFKKQPERRLKAKQAKKDALGNQMLKRC